MKVPASTLVLKLACLLALFALGLIVWSVLDPRPIPVVVAMSVGQVIGTFSFAAFLFVVVKDVRSRYRAVVADSAGATKGATEPTTPRARGGERI